MLRRILFIILFILFLPTGILAMFLFAFLTFTVSPIVWIFTGDADKAFFEIPFNGVTYWLISLPWRLSGISEV